MDERIAWNSAINNSVSVVPYDRGAVVDWTVEVSIVAHHIYPLIRMGPLPPVEDAPQRPVQAPEPNVDPVVDAWDGEPPFSGDMEEPGPEVFEI